MRFFDLHCDTVTECRESNMRLGKNTLHLDFDRAQALDAWAQVFAVWIPDTLRGDDAWRYFSENADFFRQEIESLPARFCRSVDDMDTAMRGGQTAAFLAVEGGAVLGGQLERLDRLFETGVRLMTLTWNGENELGFGCQSCGGGLKPFGIEAVRRMDVLRMIVDVSHLHAQGFWDVLRTTERPVIASHSTSAAVLRDTRQPSTDTSFSLRRALEDDQIRAVAARGGLIGLNFCDSFLGDPGSDGMDAALHHVQHIIAVGGENALAIGSDFDGCTIHPSMAGIDKIPDLYMFFRQNGFSDRICDKIFFQNAWNFWKSML